VISVFLLMDFTLSEKIHFSFASVFSHRSSLGTCQAPNRLFLSSHRERSFQRTPFVSMIVFIVTNLTLFDIDCPWLPKNPARC